MTCDWSNLVPVTKNGFSCLNILGYKLGPKQKTQFDWFTKLGPNLIGCRRLGPNTWSLGPTGGQAWAQPRGEAWAQILIGYCWKLGPNMIGYPKVDGFGPKIDVFLLACWAQARKRRWRKRRERRHCDACASRQILIGRYSGPPNPKCRNC